MPRHLDHDYEVDTKPTGFIPHLYDTLESIGGIYGILIICILIIAFYLTVDFYIAYNRTKKENKKKR